MAQISFIKKAVTVGEDVPFYEKPSTLTRPLDLLLSVAHLRDMLKTPKKSDIVEFLNSLSEKNKKQLDLPEQELAIYPNYDPILEKLKRLYGRDDIGILKKLLGTAVIPISSLISTIFRSDYYEPFSHSIVLRHARPAILALLLLKAKLLKKKQILGAITNLPILGYGLVPATKLNSSIMKEYLDYIKAKGASKEKIKEIVSAYNQFAGALGANPMNFIPVAKGPTANFIRGIIAGGEFAPWLLRPFKYKVK